MFFALMISVWMSADTLGTGIAENEYLEVTTQEVIQETSDIGNAVAQLVGLETVFQTAFSKSESMYKSEITNGGINAKSKQAKITRLIGK